MVYDMEADVMVTREEYNRRQKEKAPLEGIAESDEEEDDAGT